MKSLPYGDLGNRNLKGKKSKTLYCGKYVEGDMQNFKEAERKKEDRKEIQKMLGFSRISSNGNKY
jgi:hypothetical protein